MLFERLNRLNSSNNEFSYTQRAIFEISMRTIPAQISNEVKRKFAVEYTQTETGKTMQ